MTIIYNIIIRLYSFAIGIASISNKKARLWKNGRKNLMRTIESAKISSQTAWFHCASLGEFEQGRPVIEKFKQKHPDIKVVLTFFSPSGYEVQKNYANANYVFYLPVDTKQNAKRFIQLINPKIVFFVKYEFWHHYIKSLYDIRIPVYSISSIFRNDQIFFKWYGKWYRNILKRITYFFVQNQESEKILKSIGIENVKISGDTRFDRVFEIAQSAKSIPVIEKFINNSLIFIAGSSWSHDEEIIIKYINNHKSHIKYIFAPHEIHPSNINRLCNSIKKKTVRYSEAKSADLNKAEVLIIDNIGMLTSAYKYANIAYVGGGFKTGLHNVLEPATFGIPVICGPIFSKFQEATDLVKQKGLIAISSYPEFENTMQKLIENEKYRKETGNICKTYINDKKGATDVIINHI